MSLPFIVFFVCAILAVLAALTLILAREPIHSALSLILVMCSLAVLYLLLGAEFIAAVQIIVYAGAIMVLFVFVIMLLNAGVEERTDYSKLAKYAGRAAGHSSCCSRSGIGCGLPSSASRLRNGSVAVRRISLHARTFRKCFFSSICSRLKPPRS